MRPLPRQDPHRPASIVLLLLAAAALMTPAEAAAQERTPPTDPDRAKAERKAAEDEREAAKDAREAAEEAAEEREEEAERRAKEQRKQAKLDREEIEEFLEQAEKYAELREDLLEEVGAAPPKDAEPATVQRYNERLKAAIRVRRADARQGDIFTPRLRDAFLRLFRQRLVGKEGAAERQVLLQEGNPMSDEEGGKPVPIKINGDYPLGAPLSTVPPTLLQILPDLPEQLRYRFVGRTLILRDIDANIIIDYLPDAVP